MGEIARSRILFLVGLSAALVASAAIPYPALWSFSQPQSPLATPPPSASGSLPATPPLAAQSQGLLNIVVLDPAHGGTDFGARGAAGIHESEVILDFAAEVRRALESQGFQVLQTRQGNDNPSFDDRSTLANAQRGAVFITLHISSTGLPGTVRVYANSDLPPLADSSGIIPWDRAQAPFLPLSRKFGELMQGVLAQRFKGSPDTVQTASVRQLRTTAAPAIAVELSSIIVNDRTELERMAPGLAEAIARGVVAFKPFYVIPALVGARP